MTEIACFLPVLGLSAEDNRQVLREIANENGLLKEQARGWYGFLHLTLQEYFAAIAINDQSRYATLISQCADPWWEEVLLLYAGQTPDASSLLLYLLGKDSTHPRKDDLFRTNLLMAGRCLISCPAIQQRNLREEVIESIIDLCLQTSYYWLKSRIREILVMIGGDAVISRRKLYRLPTQHAQGAFSQQVRLLDLLQERSLASLSIYISITPKKCNPFSLRWSGMWYNRFCNRKTCI